MVVSYIRPDKYFNGVYDQLNMISIYMEQKGLKVEKEFIDQISQNKKLDERDAAIGFLRSLQDSVLVIYDAWVLSSHIDDLVQMFSCQLKNGNTIHLVKQSIVIDRDSDVMVVLGLIDQVRQILESEARKSIGRPKGSRSSSKFDKYHDNIIKYLKERRSVSEMARIFGVSRSSLKDYIESRELKEVAEGTGVPLPDDGEAKVLETIKCPETTDRSIAKETI